jgi:hypothetical protein
MVENDDYLWIVITGKIMLTMKDKKYIRGASGKRNPSGLHRSVEKECTPENLHPVRMHPQRDARLRGGSGFLPSEPSLTGCQFTVRIIKTGSSHD